MIRYDPTLYIVCLTSNFFVLCTNMKAYLMNYSRWVELSMRERVNIGYKHGFSFINICQVPREMDSNS